MHIPILSSVLQYTNEVCLVGPPPFDTPDFLDVVRIKYHDVLFKLRHAISVQQAVRLRAPCDSIFKELLKGWHAGAILHQTEEVREDFRSRDLVVGSCTFCDGSGRTPSSMMHPRDLLESRTHRQSNTSHCVEASGFRLEVNTSLWTLGSKVNYLAHRAYVLAKIICQALEHGSFVCPLLLLRPEVHWHIVLHPPGA